MKTYQEEITGKYFSLEEREPHPDSGEMVKIIIIHKEEKPRR